MSDEMAHPQDELTAGDDSLVDRLRESPVGVQDPNIVGDAGPLDIPPGTDPDTPTDSTSPIIEADVDPSTIQT